MTLPNTPNLPVAATSGNGNNGYKPPDQVRILFDEVGTSGLKAYAGFVNEAYNSALFWPQVEPTYSKLLSHPTISMVWRTFQSWGKQVKPTVSTIENPTDDDKAYKDFLESDFDNMEGGFGKYMDTAAYLPIMFGFCVFETPLSRRDPNWVPPVLEGRPPDDWRSEADDGLIGIRRIALRKGFYSWKFDDDKKVIGMWQQDFPKQKVLIRIDKDHSLHHTIGDVTNPEGKAGLESCWREEKLQYGYQTIHAIGTEHSAGYYYVEKTESGTLSESDFKHVEESAKNVLSAQESNYVYMPYGLKGQIIDTNFQSAGATLEAIKYFDIVMLSIFSMQGMALNTLTNTGALASQVDTSDMAVFNFNSMIDGLARQYDEQIGKRLWRLNRASFPNATKRPKITFSHVDRNIALATLGSFIQSINGIIPLGDDDNKLIRQKTGGVLAPTDPTPEQMVGNAPALDRQQNPLTNAQNQQPAGSVPLADNVNSQS